MSVTTHNGNAPLLLCGIETIYSVMLRNMLTRNIRKCLPGVYPKKKKIPVTHSYRDFKGCNCVLVGTRTLDPLIKSQLLYQLSYEDIFIFYSDLHFNLIIFPRRRITQWNKPVV